MKVLAGMNYVRFQISIVYCTAPLVEFFGGGILLLNGSLTSGYN